MTISVLAISDEMVDDDGANLLVGEVRSNSPDTDSLPNIILNIIADQWEVLVAQAKVRLGTAEEAADDDGQVLTPTSLKLINAEGTGLVN